MRITKYRSLSDDELLRVAENSEDELMIEMCKRFEENIDPECNHVCLDCGEGLKCPDLKCVAGN